MRNWIATLRNRGLVAQVSVLGLAVLAAYALVAPAAVALSGWAGLAASATAATVCLVGAGASLIASRAFARRGKTLQGVVIGMPLRMGIPLLGAVAIQLSVKPLADANLLVHFLVFYPVTLSVETFLSLPQANALHDGEDASPDVAP